jgi:membrane associated rhomboid family serine protease
MTRVPEPASASVPLLLRIVRVPFGLLAIALIAMWAIELLDPLVLDNQLQGNGIRPRHRSGLDGILWAPFLHVDFGHLASNSVPLLALGGLVSARGMRYWLATTLTVIIIGGGAVWLVAREGNHLGASGLVFGYFGAIIGAAIFERRLRALGAALIALGFYSGLVAGIVPQDALSWEGHLFGMLAGTIASRIMAEPRITPDERPDNPQPWEADEPWLN